MASENIAKLFEGAPEGATHWEPESDGVAAGWMRACGPNWYYWPPADSDQDKVWHRSMVSGKRAAAMIPRPADKQWNGEGLPPVGTVCEFKSVGHHSDPEYQWCIFHGIMSCGGYIVEYHHHTSPEMVTCAPFDPALTTFRPIRTPEQIAAEEREKAIDAMAKIGRMADNPVTFAQKLYDAGYRKQPDN